MAITAGDNLNSVPAPRKQTLNTNYLDFTGTANSWGQQYLPDLMEKEAEVFGPRTISGFLAQIGAEEAMQSDQVVWSEQGRLHLSYKGKIIDGSGGTTGGTSVNGQAACIITIEKDIDGKALHSNGHGIRVNDLVIVSDTTNGIVKCLVTKVTATTAEVLPYDRGAATLSASATAESVRILVFGSEFGKGMSYVSAASSRGANEPRFQTFTNKPIIMKDYYEVSGSDASRIGWVEVSAENGQSGYLWYLKAEADTRARFNDYIEMAMLESELNDSSSVIDGATDYIAGSASGDGTVGTEGLFAAIESRGNITTGVTGVNAATDLAEFDAILAEFDKQGAIEEYMMFVNRSTSLAIDDMLASMNSYGAGGTSYGVFNNSEDMALNLGFTGFRRGSYDFYKSDFRYLNDLATRGSINAQSPVNAIRGVMIPAGTTSVYDQTVGSSIKRPFLHVRFRASATDDRRMKTWVTGSVGAATTALDAMQLHFLTERCLITQAANNFMLMK